MQRVAPFVGTVTKYMSFAWQIISSLWDAIARNSIENSFLFIFRVLGVVLLETGGAHCVTEHSFCVV